MIPYGHVDVHRRYLFDLPDSERSAACKHDLWINAPHVEQLISKIGLMLKVENKVQAPCLLVHGRGGAGKTSVAQRLQQIYSGANEKLIFVNMRQNPNNYNFRELLFSQFGISVSKHARATGDVSAQLQVLIASQGIKGIVIDEVHDALTLTALQQRINLSLLKNLSGADFRMSVFAFGTEDAHQVLRADPQLARRYAMHHLSDWEWGAALRNFIATFITNLPLKNKTNTSDEVLLLSIFKQSGGIMDNVVKLLQVCAAAAVLDGTECIDLALVENTPELCDAFGVAWGTL